MEIKELNKFFVKECCEKNFSILRKNAPSSQVKAGTVLNGELIWFDSNENCEIEKSFNEPIAIYSLTKLFTALLCMEAVNENKINMDYSIVQYLGDFKLYYRGEDYAPKITIRNLLSHTSGLMHEAFSGNNYYASDDLKSHVESVNGNELLFIPGSNYKYSNLGFDIVGYILSWIYEEKFETLMQHKIFEKFNMNNTKFSSYNRALAPSNGIISTMMDLLNALRLMINEKFISFFGENTVKNEIESIHHIMNEQNSGFGLGCKIFKTGNIEYCVVTGLYADNYITQMWSTNHQLGVVMHARIRINLVIELLNKYDIFSNIICQIAVGDVVQEKFVDKSEIIDYFLNTNFLEYSYMSFDNRIRYLVIFGDDAYISSDKEKWSNLKKDAHNMYCNSEMNLIIDFNDSISGFYMDGLHEFGYYFKNDEQCDVDIKEIVNEKDKFILDIKLANSDLEKEQMLCYNLFNKVTLKQSNGRVYLNGLMALKHIHDNIFELVTGVCVVINDDSIKIGNVILSKR